MKNIKDYSLEDLKEQLKEIGEKPYRAANMSMVIHRESTNI